MEVPGGLFGEAPHLPENDPDHEGAHGNDERRAQKAHQRGEQAIQLALLVLRGALQHGVQLAAGFTA